MSNPEKIKKYKAILALGMAVVITSAMVEYNESKCDNFLDFSFSFLDRDRTNNTNNLFIARTDNETYLLFCPDDRGVCVNYETEEFMFMYKSEEEKTRNLKSILGEDVVFEDINKHLEKKFGTKEGYTSDEIFLVFNELKNNNKTLVKS